MTQQSKRLLAHAFTLLLTLHFSSTTCAAADAPANGMLYTVQERPLMPLLTLGGTVIPAKEVTLSAQLPGRVDVLAGSEGEPFKANTVLVQINDAELQAQRRAALAELGSAEAVLRNADVQFSRELYSPDSLRKAPGGMGVPHMFDQLFTEPANDIVGRSDSVLDRQADLHTFRTQIEQARNAWFRAQSSIESIDIKIRDARSLAPFDGVITDKLVEVGDTVQPGQPLVKFADIQNLQIQVEVPARLVPGLRLGMLWPARLDVGGWVQVRVAQIFPIADPQRHTVTVKFDLPPNTPIGAGQYAQVEIQDMSTPPTPMILIPRDAINWRGSLPAVNVIKAENQRELRLLRLGKNYGNEVSVISGLRAGETIEIQHHSGQVPGNPWAPAPVTR